MPLSVDHSIRKRLELREGALSRYAVRSKESRGRTISEHPSPLRTEFQRDRDRILYTKAFRRLKHKTQVFLAPQGDHYVTRLTHTLEVTQISRTIARALNLNEDLTEAIALGHDLGHTPFGHIGEQTLDHLLTQGFRHSEQSLRIVDVLEKDGVGLNLTWEVRQGIVNHSKPRKDFLSNDISADLTLEAQVCRIADAVAYLNHDIDDALRAEVIHEEDLPKQVKICLGERSSERVNSMVSSIIIASWSAAGEESNPPGLIPKISVTPEVEQILGDLREFLFEQVYLPESRSDEGRMGSEVVELLFSHYCRNPQDIPQEYRIRDESPEQMATDYISGMTDHYALRHAERIQPSVILPFSKRAR